MKKIIIIATILLSVNSVFAQWEFQYFVLRVGANHHSFSGQPDTLYNFYAQTPEGEMRMTPVKNYLEYNPGYHLDLLFHIDFKNDNGGLVFGAQYMNMSISAKYQSINQKYNLIEKHTVHAIGLPVFVKFGKEIFDRQFYGYAGGQYNFNMDMYKKQTASWDVNPLTMKAEQQEYLSGNALIFIGFNYMFFNIQFDYYPQNFLNPDYIVNVGSNSDVIVKPYSVQPKNLFLLRTSLSIPLSPWTTKRIYFLHRFFQRIF